MSSAEEDDAAIKKRRVQRACDSCRRRKIRCDGGSTAGDKCSNCVSYKTPCTYESTKKRSQSKSYYGGLEKRVESLEALLHRLHPDLDLTKELDNIKRDDVLAQNMSKLTTSSDNKSERMCWKILDDTVQDADIYSSEEEDDILQKRYVSRIDPHHPKFLGKSSGLSLIQKTMRSKLDYTGGPMLGDGIMRPCFWQRHPWELEVFKAENPNYEFPDQSIMFEMIDLYFRNVNNHAPLLHEPTFIDLVSKKTHLYDVEFGAVLLLVCACGSKFSDKPSARLVPEEPMSSGWQWFQQVHYIKSPIIAPASLSMLQIYALAVMFLQCATTSPASWIVVGVGIRLAQDLGAHRKKTYKFEPNIHDELLKRAFWVLVAVDRYLSCSLGRTCSIHSEDIDCDYPIEVDDEYWVRSDPSLNFKQPVGKPSKISHWTAALRLTQIMAFALRSIYAINKSKVMMGGAHFEEDVVAELDSALNRWVDTIPEHLKWDPHRERLDHFANSAKLYSQYYNLQIFVHRPFIAGPQKPTGSNLAFPSLAICTNAARSCSHILDVYMKRTGATDPTMVAPAFCSGLVLLLNIWGGKRSELAINVEKEMKDVKKCMDTLKAAEDRMHTAGKMYDVLAELASVSDLPMPKSNARTAKRGYDSTSYDHWSPPSFQPDSPQNRPLAGSKRAQNAVTSSSSSASSPSTDGSNLNILNLPLHSNELGSLPLYNYPKSHSSHSSQSTPPENFWYPPATTMQEENSTMFSMPIMDMGISPNIPNKAPNGMNGMNHTYQWPESDVTQETMALWSQLPSGFDFGDWGDYIQSMDPLGMHMQDVNAVNGHAA